MSIQVRERMTEEQYRRKQRNARVLEQVDRDNARVGADLRRRQADLVEETVDRYRKPLMAEASGEAIRNEKHMVEDMKQYARREGIAHD